MRLRGYLHRHPKPAEPDLFDLTLPGKAVLYLDDPMIVMERDYRHENGEITIRLRPLRARRAG